MRPTLSCQFRLRKTLARISRTRPDILQPDQSPLWAAYYRGGTSRAVIIQPQDLPSNRAKWSGIFRQLVRLDQYGTPSRGPVLGTSRLSNICLVEPSHKSIKESNFQIEKPIKTQIGNATSKEPDLQDTRGADIDYTFICCDVDNGELEIAGNCGDMASAIGPYAYNARLLPPDMYAVKNGHITVRMRNTNTNKLIHSTFSVSSGQAAVKGNYTVDGVANKGSMVKLHFERPGGSQTGKIFPTGRKIDTINGYRVTCIDGATPVVFIRADAIRVPGTILPHEFTHLQRRDEMELLEGIRKAAAVAMGVADTEATVARTVPKIAIVSQSSEHEVLSGMTLKPSQMDIIVRFISDTRAHPTIPLTGAVTTAMAARIRGTVVEQLLAPDLDPQGDIIIGHACGRVRVGLNMTPLKQSLVTSATVCSTAKRLFEGKAFWTNTSEDVDKMSDEATVCHGLGSLFVHELRAREASQPLLDAISESESNVDAKQASSLLEDAQEKPLSSTEASNSNVPQDPVHLLRELSALQSSLEHFRALYPSPSRNPSFPNPMKRTAPTPSNISHHISAISHHIGILTHSLQTLPQPTALGPETPTPEVGKSWHKWAEQFSRHTPVRRLREANEKKERANRNKPEWRRRRDAHLNVLDEKGQFVKTGTSRRALLEQRSDEDAKKA
ncbi:hypothetical protein N0V90_005764 [Kalmusia sp. IMI 367209]|nr:hypothetical protein N0V90_005764 [Kalmusia sp. IMI 367209]